MTATTTISKAAPMTTPIIHVVSHTDPSDPDPPDSTTELLDVDVRRRDGWLVELWCTEVLDRLRSVLDTITTDVLVVVSVALSTAAVELLVISACKLHALTIRTTKLQRICSELGYTADGNAGPVQSYKRT